MTHESLFSALLAPFLPPPPHRYSNIPTVLHLSTTKLEGCKFQSIDPRSSACRVVEYHCNFKVTITLQTVCLMALLLLLLAYVVYYGSPLLTWNSLTRFRLTQFLAIFTGMWVIFALVESLEQSQWRKFCETTFFSSPKIHVMQGTLEHISAQYIMLEISQLWSSQNWNLQKSRIPNVKAQIVDWPTIQFWTLWPNSIFPSQTVLSKN